MDTDNMVYNPSPYEGDSIVSVISGGDVDDYGITITECWLLSGEPVWLEPVTVDEAVEFEAELQF